MKRLCVFVILTFTTLFCVNAQQLSQQARVSIITCADGEEIYSTFGHSAIRISDPIKGLDYVFNYGVFDFNAPDFLWNFVTGKPLYRINCKNVDNFLLEYQYYNRSVKEQVLDLSLRQKQKVFYLLQENLLPENVNYVYDYFLNNCSTKVDSLFKIALSDSLELNIDIEKHRNKGFRGMIEPHLQGSMQWDKFGIDLIVGYKDDIEVSAEKTMFLPKNLYSIYDSAKVFNNGQWKPIVSERHNLFVAYFKPNQEFPWWLSPLFVCWTIFTFVLFVSVVGWIKGNQSWILERFLWSINAIMGFIIVFMWFFTSHIAFQYNLNLLWLSPFSLVFLFTGSGKVGVIIKKTISRIILVMPILWWFLPQYFNPAAFPLLLIFVVRIIKRIEGNFNHIKE